MMSRFSRLGILAVAGIIVPACGGGGGGALPPFVLILPAAGDSGVSTNPTYSWSRRAGTTDYLLQVSTDPGFASVLIHVPGLTTTSHTPSTSLAPGTPYYWRVYSNASAGTFLAKGSPALFTTAPAPGAFTLVSPPDGAVDVSTSVMFSWNASTDAAGYTLQVATDSGLGNLVIDQSGIATTSIAPSAPLATSTLFYWQVLAVNGAGSVLATGSPRSFTTAPPPPGSFSLTSPAGGATDVSITPTYSWGASSDAASYTLEVSTLSDFSSHVVNQSGLPTTSHSPSGSLDTSTTYYWKVTAVNVTGSTLATGAPRSFTTGPPATITLFPTDLVFTATAAGANPTSQVVQITNPAGTSTPLRWSVTSDRPWLQFSPLSGTTLTETDLLTVSPVISQAEAWTTDITLTGAPIGRENHCLVWTGSEMIVWGGSVGFGGGITGDGKKYDPSTDTWTGTVSTTNAPSARWGHTGIWTGTEMIVWGGRDNSGYFNQGYRYNPKTDTWSGPIAVHPGFVGRRSPSAAWTGTEMIIWGGESGAAPQLSGARYNPSLNSWQSISNTGLAPARWHHTAVWTGTEMIVRGGWDGGSHLNTGVAYDLSGDSWTGAISTTGTPPGLSGATAVWNGSEMIVWGGLPSVGQATNEGARYDPVGDTWLGAMTTTNAAVAVRSHGAVWAGSEMIIWGGYDGGAFRNTGKRYRPPISLPAGVYTGTLTVRDPDATNSPQTITVTLTVNP